MNDTLLWAVRAYVYAHFAATTQPPTAADIGAHFDISLAEAEGTLRTLHDRHALFLQPDTTAIRLANPFSGVPTLYRVATAGLTYMANCAWDSLGIPVALGATEARITSVCVDDSRDITLDIHDGELDHNGPEVAHFLVPFRHWYDDLIHT